jgi:hypothetical protein
MQRRQTSWPRFPQISVAFARHARAPISGMKLRHRGREWKITSRLRGAPEHRGVQMGRSMPRSAIRQAITLGPTPSWAPLTAHTVPMSGHTALGIESSRQAHSVPRPAFGGAMLTLLRVRRVARLRRRLELNGASRPLRSAGSWQPSFSWVRPQPCALCTPHEQTHAAAPARPANLQTTNLGVGSSNLSGPARKINDLDDCRRFK